MNEYFYSINSIKFLKKSQFNCPGIWDEILLYFTRNQEIHSNHICIYLALLSFMYNRKKNVSCHLIICIMYIDLQNPNLKSIFVSQCWKAPIIRKNGCSKNSLQQYGQSWEMLTLIVVSYYYYISFFPFDRRKRTSDSDFVGLNT